MVQIHKGERPAYVIVDMVSRDATATRLSVGHQIPFLRMQQYDDYGTLFHDNP